MMMVIHGEYVSSALLLGLLTSLWLLYSWTRRHAGLPPFPLTPLPVIGNMLSLQKDPRKQFRKWRQQYGDIFSLYMGSKLVIVLNGYSIVKDALVKHADTFSDRPDLFVFTTAFQGRGIGASSGPLWKSQRTFAVKTLRNLGVGKNILEEKILEETERMLSFIASKNGLKEDFGPIYQVASSNILYSMTFGKGFEYDDAIFHECCEAINELVSSISNTGGVNFLPFLQYVPGDFAGIKSVLNKLKRVEEKLINPEIENHFKNFDGTTDDFVYAYIKEIKDTESSGEDTTVLRENLSQTVVDFFLGGTQPTATTLKWFVLYLICFPEVQEKCFQELQDNIGLGRLPGLKDKASLPYVEATLAETQRLANILALGALHGTSENTTLNGFNIPTGTIIMPNMDLY